MGFFTQSDAITFIEKIFGNVQLTNNGLNATVVCPKCKITKGTAKKKLAIRTDDFKMHCWSCGFKGRNILYLLRRYSPGAVPEYMVKFHQENITEYPLDVNQENIYLKLPDGFELLAENINNPIPNYQNSINYLYSRGLSERDLWYFKFGITTKDKRFYRRVIFPSFDRTGHLNYYTGRSINPKEVKRYYDCEEGTFDKNSIIFNESKIDWKEPLTIVEGPFDLAKCGYNTTCLLGNYLSEESLLFSRILQHSTKIILALDNDMQPTQQRLAKMLSEFDIQIFLLPIPANKKDVGELSKTEFESLIKTNLVPWNNMSNLIYKLRMLEP